MSALLSLIAAAAGAAAGWFVCRIVDRATKVRERNQSVLAIAGSAVLVTALSLKYRTNVVPLVIYSGLVVVLVGVTIFDIRKHEIPHLVTIPGMILGLILGSTALPLGMLQSVLGFLVGGGILVVATIVETLRKKEIGGGDWKFAAMIGSLIGPQRIVVALVLTGVFGFVGAIVLAVSGNHGRPQALGPWLSAGAVASILLG